MNKLEVENLAKATEKILKTIYKVMREQDQDITALAGSDKTAVKATVASFIMLAAFGSVEAGVSKKTTLKALGLLMDKALKEKEDKTDGSE